LVHPIKVGPTGAHSDDYRHTHTHTQSWFVVFVVTFQSKKQHARHAVFRLLSTIRHSYMPCRDRVRVHVFSILYYTMKKQRRPDSRSFQTTETVAYTAKRCRCSKQHCRPIRSKYYSCRERRRIARFRSLRLIQDAGQTMHVHFETC